MGDFIIAIFVTLVAVIIPVINYSNGIDTTFFGRSFKVKLFYFIIIPAGWQINFQIDVPFEIPMQWI